jgi:hypothetical protein
MKRRPNTFRNTYLAIGASLVAAAVIGGCTGGNLPGVPAGADKTITAASNQVSTALPAIQTQLPAVQTQLPGLQTQVATAVSGAQTAVATVTVTR